MRGGLVVVFYCLDASGEGREVAVGGGEVAVGGSEIAVGCVEVILDGTDEGADGGFGHVGAFDVGDALHKADDGVEGGELTDRRAAVGILGITDYAHIGEGLRTGYDALLGLHDLDILLGCSCEER